MEDFIEKEPSFSSKEGVEDEDKFFELLQTIDEKKTALDARRPLSPEVIHNLKEYFDVEWTHHSTAIEGNTLSLGETRVVIQDGLTIGGKSVREHLEIINHKYAVDFVESLLDPSMPVSESEIKQIHALILREIDDDNAGKYRSINVRISGSEHRPPEHFDVPLKMEAFVKWLNSEESKKLHPVERAAQAHLDFVYIHPFADGNGRCARLVQNLLLMREGFPPAVIRKDERGRYFDALEKAHLKGEKQNFLVLVAQAVERSLKVYLDVAR